MLDELSVCFIGRTVHKIEPWGFCSRVDLWQDVGIHL